MAIHGEPEYYMFTQSSNTQTDLNVCQAADDIIEIFEKLGFTSDTPPDIELLRHSIVEAIQKRTTPKVVEGTLGEANVYIKYFKEANQLKPNKNVKVPEYDYLTEGFDPSKLPKKAK